ncbi:hypothetical protein [Lysobacter capsici]|uniref:hypothetical protein n=1 Tax=Lysobacter capsici TaxID=435897 RepID=UPI00287B73FB|nr:hypothetical protein [Lysobacter capsici]WND81127.1 hypothetical protein RJ610_01745 [Lysobacter capsici]WND86323.1 hypothetical protein RJ609_01745 [Lysobacter capsici]
MTGKTLADYRASFEPVYAEMNAHEREAFDWAVSDLDQATLHGRYPNGSAREVIRGEVRSVLRDYPKALRTLQAEYERLASVRAELVKVTARGGFAIEKDFFGFQPTITSEITNGSRYPISRLAWEAALYLNGAGDPFATARVTSDFRSRNGLRPGDTYKVTSIVGFVKGDDRWTSLEVRNAHSVRVALTPVLTSIEDFAGRQYLAVDTARKLKSMRIARAAAERYADI